MPRLKIVLKLFVVFSYFLSGYLLSANKPILTKKVLQGSSWQVVIGYDSIEFLAGDKVRYTSSAPSSPDYITKGKFKIKNNQVKLYELVLQPNPETESKAMKEKPMSCTYGPTKSLEFAAMLNCGDWSSYYQKNNKRKAGTEMKVKNVAVILTGVKDMKATTNVKIRSKPSIRSPRVTYISAADADLYKELAYLPKGRSITVLARTRAKEKVQKWRNYWYYVRFKGSPGPGMIQEDEFGWVFGEFLK